MLDRVVNSKVNPNKLEPYKTKFVFEKRKPYDDSLTDPLPTVSVYEDPTGETERLSIQ